MEPQYGRFVVPVTGVPADAQALEVVRRLANNQPVILTLLHVVEVAQSMPLDAELPDEIFHGETALRDAETTARTSLSGKGTQILTELLQARSVGAAVVDEAIERNADAIVMIATIGRKHGRPTLGETVNYILLNAPCDVVVARLAPADEPDGEDTWR